ncbi:DivIVA domain-containing protein [Marisediminicola sp. LYQ85]|uniref:DivIVA domain-containing protein n=1 Tax=Marisediminicola sp. LYQ85 TaxID=3391062 RepID=UPI003982EA82
MALTPEDVVNKRFQPTKFREGYDQDEVDDFLDEVVVELRRLGQENEELRQRVSAGGSDLSAAAPAPTAVVETAPEPESAPEPEPTPEPDPTPEVVAAPVAVTPAPTTTAPSAELDPNNTNNLLQLARRLHEEHVKEGMEKRDALIAEGRASAERIASDAQAEQKALVARLETERSVVERRIEGLRTFEREYRQKLKGYIEGQLRELDSSSGDMTSSTPGASAGIGNQAFGGN